MLRRASVISNDPKATLPARALRGRLVKQSTLFKKDDSFRSPLWPGSPQGWKRRRRLSEPEANIQ